MLYDYIKSSPFGCYGSVGGLYCGTVRFPSNIELILSLNELPIRNFFSEGDLLFAGSVQSIGSGNESTSKNKQAEREQGYGIARRPLPEGFALFCLGGALFGGIVTFLFLFLGKRV
jgi:hypothetical protein